jgi:hypothetical protein
MAADCRLKSAPMPPTLHESVSDQRRGIEVIALTSRESPAQPNRDVGLCSLCRFATTQLSSRESTFWRCRRADVDPKFQRYPPLPVAECAGFELEDSGPRVPSRP